MNTPCQSKNPATCRYHGIPESKIDFENEVFNIDFESTSKRNFRLSDNFKFVITKEEEEAIMGYCSQDFSKINLGLNSQGTKLSKKRLKQISHIDEALKKFPPGEQQLVYRATRPYFKDGDGSFYEFDTPEDAAGFYEKMYPVGKILTFNSFTSTTEDPNSLTDFTSPGFDSHPPTGMYATTTRAEYNANIGKEGLSNIIYEIKTAKGAPLSAFGQTYATKEQEVLLPRGIQFKVVALHTNKMMTFINRLPFRDRPDKRMVTVVQLVEV